MSCSNGEMPVAAAEAGPGVLVEPTSITHDAIAAGRLVPLLTDHVWWEDAAFAIHPCGRPPPLRVRSLVDHPVAHLTPEPQWDACWRQRSRAGDTTR
jgi:DNA-binding transcriptional LysR family regulator